MEIVFFWTAIYFRESKIQARLYNTMYKEFCFNTFQLHPLNGNNL